jgi:hypothetical protein
MTTKTLIDKIRRYGIVGSAQKAFNLVTIRWNVRNAPEYHNPTPEELIRIEQDLQELGVIVKDYASSPKAFTEFQAAQ